MIDAPKERCILIVDDDEQVGQSLAIAVSTIPGLRAIVVRHGAAALGIAADPAVLVRAVITDFHLPHFDGLQLIRKLRELPGYADVPVLMITADDTKTSMNGCTLERPNIVLHKPCSHREVRRVLERLLS
jgi:putative two-component system response regulator